VTMELRSPNLRDLRSALGLSRDSLGRVLSVTGRTVERWEAGQDPSSPDHLRQLDHLAEVVTLGREVYGDDLSRFMGTPRRSLGRRTPTETLLHGDIEAVIRVLAKAAEGQWA